MTEPPEASEELVFRPETWKDLQDFLFRDSFDENLSRYRSSYVYRGLNNHGFTLQTSLARLGGNFANLERHILRNFKKYAKTVSRLDPSNWNWLAIAQHHGLPTRLLDWTYSPYVALHFATSDIDTFDQDGIIWCVNYVKTNKLLPDKLKIVIQEEGSNTFTAEMLDSVGTGVFDLEKLREEPFVLFLEPPSLDDRITNQYALFSLMSSPQANLSDWLEKNKSLHFKIIIPAHLKWEVRDKLDQANITERVLFPGLEGLSAWLKRLYSPKTGGTGLGPESFSAKPSAMNSPH